MPVLHRYRHEPGHFVKASIRGAVGTFQITETGVRKLLESGIAPGDKFPLSQLFDLVRDGDAYTGGRAGATRAEATEFYEAEQFEFDFSEDREIETLYPQCEATGSAEDLHLVTHGEGAERRTRLLSPAGREGLSAVELSLPFTLISTNLLAQLLAADKVVGGCPALGQIERWLAARRSDYWERHRQAPSRQGELGLVGDGELDLQ